MKDLAVFSIVLFLFFASFATLFGVSIYELTREKPDKNLLFLGDEDTQLRVTDTWTTLYNYFTEQDGEGLKSYRGEYKIVLSSSTGVNFRVIDENNNVIGSSVQRGGSYLESTVSFNTGSSEVSNIILQYNSTHNAVVSRIEISL